MTCPTDLSADSVKYRLLPHPSGTYGLEVTSIGIRAFLGRPNVDSTGEASRRTGRSWVWRAYREMERVVAATKGIERDVSVRVAILAMGSAAVILL